MQHEPQTASVSPCTNPPSLPLRGLFTWRWRCDRSREVGGSGLSSVTHLSAVQQRERASSLLMAHDAAEEPRSVQLCSVLGDLSMSRTAPSPCQVAAHVPLQRDDCWGQQLGACWIVGPWQHMPGQQTLRALLCKPPAACAWDMCMNSLAINSTELSRHLRKAVAWLAARQQHARQPGKPALYPYSGHSCPKQCLRLT